MATAETRYLPLEKLTLALVMAAKKLNHSYYAHAIIVLTKYPLKSFLQHEDLSRRIARWVVILG